MIKILITILLLFSPTLVIADSSNNQPLLDLSNTPSNTSVLNDQLRQNATNINNLLNNVGDINAKTTGILQASRGGTGQDSSNWTSGDLVYMSSTGVWGHITPVVNYHGSQLFTNSGTFTAPAGISLIYVTEIGGGGSGYTSTSGTGGTGAEYLINYPVAVTPLATYTVTIGAGGTSGSAGGATSIGSLSVAGGLAGVTGTSPLTGPGGFNGSGTTAGTKFFQGGNAGGNASGGAGGGSPFGAGGAGGTGGSGGNNGTGYGSGGSSDSSTPGAGASGLVIVQY